MALDPQVSATPLSQININGSNDVNRENGVTLQCGLCHSSLLPYWLQLRCCRLVFCRTCATALDAGVATWLVVCFKSIPCLICIHFALR
jgi:hypothetical protein